VAVHQGLFATPPPCQPYDRWKGEALQTPFWCLDARSDLREPTGWDDPERRQGEPHPLNALNTDMYHVTLSRIGKNALKMPICFSTAQRLTGRTRHKRKNSHREAAPFLCPLDSPSIAGH